jgi:glycosyltransferase involved in cell wall biosynthesis
VRVELVFPKFKLLSGAERLILSLGAALRGRGHAVRVVCHRFDPSCRVVADDLPVVETGLRLDWTGNHYLDSIASYVLATRLRRVIDSTADVVCLFGPALPLAACRGLGRRLFYFCYEPPRAIAVDSADVLARVGSLRFALAPLLRFYRGLDRRLVRRVDEVLVCGDFARGLVAAEYGVDARIVTPGTVIPADRPDPLEARRRLGLRPDQRIALTVNFLHPRKRVDLLLRTWVGVEARLPGARLLVVGDGPEAPALRELARGLGLHGVRFCGFVPEEELPSYYSASDLLVHAARQETFGLTIVEAAAHGVPAVAVDEGGPRETILEGETGLRAAPDEAALGEALVRLLSDPDGARRMGERAREHVRRRYAWERGADDFLAV